MFVVVVVVFVVVVSVFVFAVVFVLFFVVFYVVFCMLFFFGGGMECILNHLYALNTLITNETWALIVSQIEQAICNCSNAMDPSHVCLSPDRGGNLWGGLQPDL